MIIETKRNIGDVVFVCEFNETRQTVTIAGPKKIVAIQFREVKLYENVQAERMYYYELTGRTDAVESILYDSYEDAEKFAREKMIPKVTPKVEATKTGC